MFLRARKRCAVPVFRLKGSSVDGYTPVRIEQMVASFCTEGKLDPSLSYLSHIPVWKGVGFQDIMNLPSYYQTHAEMSLIDVSLKNIVDQILLELESGKRIRLWEFGPSKGNKTTRILIELDRREVEFEYNGMDICLSDLDSFEASISGKLKPSSVVNLVWGDAPSFFANREKSSDIVDVVLDFGGNVGNRDPIQSFLGDMRSQLKTGDLFLVGFHTRQPSPATILAAYNDDEVTGQFIRNALYQFGGLANVTVYPQLFSYDSVIAADGTVVMGLVATRTHFMCFPKQEDPFEIRKGFTVTVSNSKKFRPLDFTKLMEGAGFIEKAGWINESVGLRVYSI